MDAFIFNYSLQEIALSKLQEAHPSICGWSYPFEYGDVTRRDGVSIDEIDANYITSLLIFAWGYWVGFFNLSLFSTIL
jgi:hypothetical protein